jgi:uncharacterized membrane protein YgcG
VESLLFRARRRLRGQLRTAYASISGASWIDALVRMFAGGGAPVAAKVAVLGAGAAVVGSTAVVVPNVLENHRPDKTQRIPAAVVHRSKARPAPLLVERSVTTPVHAPVMPSPIAGVSSEHDATDAALHARSGTRESEHVARAETSNDRAGRGGSGDGGDRSASDRSGDGRTGDGSDGSGGDGSDGGSGVTIPAPPPLSGAGSGD